MAKCFKRLWFSIPSSSEEGGASFSRETWFYSLSFTNYSDAVIIGAHTHTCIFFFFYVRVGKGLKLYLIFIHIQRNSKVTEMQHRE